MDLVDRYYIEFYVCVVGSVSINNMFSFLTSSYFLEFTAVISILKKLIIILSVHHT
jgi:hypothetical protein